MYLQHFGLQETPFSITPDPAYLYLSTGHDQALSHLIYGATEQNGFIVLSGEVGTGKTTLVRTLLEKRLDNVDVALCLNPQLSAREFIETICDELGLDPSLAESEKQLITLLNEHLLAAYADGRRTVVIVDEAQHLDRDVLEQLRLLTNLETDKHKLMHIILVGQPELEELLQRHDLRQLAQRVTARFQLGVLNSEETKAYISHRLSTAGARPDLFTKAATQSVYKFTAGTPRLINVLCERALIVAYSQNRYSVEAKDIKQAARETWPDKVASNVQRSVWPIVAIAALAIFVLGLLLALVFWAKPDQDSVSPAESSIQGSAGIAAQQAVETSAIAKPTSARAELAKLWQVPPSALEGEAWCSEMRRFDLRCVTSSANWRRFVGFDHPALLSLNGSETLVIAVQGNQVTVADENIRTISVDDLVSAWDGRFTLLISNTVGVSVIKPGQVHSSTRWLRARMQAFDGIAPDPASDGQFYDNALQKRVEAFQQQFGLTIDGIVGATTMALLNTYDSNQQRPSLKRANVNYSEAS